MSKAFRRVACLTVTILLINVIWSGMGINTDPESRLVDDESFHTNRFYFMDATTTVLWSWILVALPIIPIVLAKGRSVDGVKPANPLPQTNPENDPSSRDRRRQFHELSSFSDSRLSHEHIRKPPVSYTNGQSDANLVCIPTATTLDTPSPHSASAPLSVPLGNFSIFWALFWHSLVVVVPGLGVAGLYTWWLVEFLAGNLQEYQLDAHITTYHHPPGYDCEHVNGETYYNVCRAEIAMALFALASVAWVLLHVIILCSREWRVRAKLLRRLRQQGGEDYELPCVRSVEVHHR